MRLRLLRTFAALLLGLPTATPMSVAAEDAPSAAKASSDCQVEKGRLPRRQASQSLAISLEELGISRCVLDDSCALDPTKEAEVLRLAENEL